MKWKSLTVIAALALSSCRASKPIVQPPQAVQTAKVGQSSGSDASRRFSAVVMPDSQVPLAFRVPGYVISLMNVKDATGRLREIGEGDTVQKGDVLANLRVAEYTEKLEQANSQATAAQAAARKAQADFERATRLYQSQSITKPEYDAACAQHDATQAQLKGAQALTGEARIALTDSKLRSPLRGEVIKKLIEVGSLVGSGTPAFVVANTDRVKIKIGVPDTGVGSLKVGAPVSIFTDAIPERVFTARVTRIAAAADPKTRSFDVEISIPNPDHVLKAGMIGTVLFSDTKKHDVNPTVPLAAVVKSSSGEYGVFTAETNNGSAIARFRQINIGNVSGNEIEVSKGLSPGDTIITTGATILKDGQPVEVLR